MNSNNRLRFAPSPTGYLHVGGARTALYNYLYANKTGGTFVLRIEDTDEARSNLESLRMQVSDLNWLGLEWAEGPKARLLLESGNYDEIGPFGPYRQSQRKSIYLEKAQALIAQGKAFHCFCSEEDLERKKQAAIAAGRAPHYDGTCRNLSPDEVAKRHAEGQKSVVRFRVPDQDYSFQDYIRGEVQFPKGMVGDFVILRSDGMPVYNFCCVVDDALMQMTHVLRAEEHLSNTARQLMLYEALGLPAPRFGHLSIILGSDRQKLSKRHGATSCNEYRERGYLPEAVNNYMALLGWSDPEGREILSMEQMASSFDLDRLHAAAAVFDEVKLKWVNSQHLRALPAKTLLQRVQGYVMSEAPEALLSKSDRSAIISVIDQSSALAEATLEVFKSSFETLLDAAQSLLVVVDESFAVGPESQEVLAWPTTRTVLERWRDGLNQASGEQLTETEFVALQSGIQAAAAVKGKQLFMPLRVAVIGKPQGVELKLLVPVLSRSSLLRRVDQVLKS